MTKSEIYHLIKPIIAEKLAVSESEILPEKTFKDLGADSLDSVDTMMEIEKQLDMAIPDNDMEKFTNIESIVDYIAGHQKTSL